MGTRLSCEKGGGSVCRGRVGDVCGAGGGGMGGTRGASAIVYVRLSEEVVGG